MSKQLMFMPNARHQRNDAPIIVRWPGAKAWLAPYLAPILLPYLLAGARYVEPFAGSLALYTELRSLGWRGRAYLNDLNADLIGLYQCLQLGRAGEVWLWFGALTSDRKERGAKLHFLSVRKDFNENVYPGGLTLEDRRCYRAALVLYFSWFGFNGLWRTNKKGALSTSFGGAERTCALTLKALIDLGALLQDALLLSGSYDAVLHASIGFERVIYADPPYDQTFSGYQGRAWNGEAQIELAKALCLAVEDGARVWLSNSDTALIRSLYLWWAVEVIPIRYKIGRGRNKESTELLLSEFWKDNSKAT